MAWRWLAGVCALAFVTTATAQTADERPNREVPVWSQLERFTTESEFLRYVRDVQRLSGERYRREDDLYSVGGPPPPPPPPPSAPPPVAGMLSEAAPTTLGNAAAQAPAADAASGEASSITNVQTQGVDEGGIVKQIGRFLIVLQDGRLFVVDTRPNGRPGLALANRTNVYRHAGADTWYDEVLVSGNRILVTGYSYRESASEITVFTIDTNTGRLTRETAYFITSNDYYDTENYATRLVNGNLVIYTPLDVSRVNVDAPMRWPLIRRWLRDDQRRAVLSEGARLFDAQDIYKPVQRTFSPFVHSVSVCPLGDLRSGDELDCRTTGFVGQTQREFFVSTADIYLWVTPGWQDGVITGDCATGDGGALPATIFQVPLDGRTPRALHARGQPQTQLALDASPEEFRALVDFNGACGRSGPREVRYFNALLASFSTTPRAAPTRSYTRTPSPGQTDYQVRFTSTHVVYGGRSSYGTYPPSEGAAPQTANVIAVPVARPANATTLQAPHNIIRIERAGADVILTGYRTDAGLSVSAVDLTNRPRITDTRVLTGRYETEGRSHAFNSLVGPEGDGLMGLPTTTRTKEGGRWWFRSQASDLSYLTLDGAGRVAFAGNLTARQNAQHPSYRCEVSCIDWYGNSRALFIGQRVFALSATELIEGEMENGRIQERNRLNLSAPAEGGA